MATVKNNSDRDRAVHGLGILKPGENKLSKEQVDKFERLTGKKLADLKGPTLKVVTRQTKKEDS